MNHNCLFCICIFIVSSVYYAVNAKHLTHLEFAILSVIFIVVMMGVIGDWGKPSYELFVSSDTSKYQEILEKGKAISVITLRKITEGSKKAYSLGEAYIKKFK